MCKIMNADERIKSEQEHIEHMKGVIKFSEESIKESEKIIERLKAEIKKQDEPPDDVRDVPMNFIESDYQKNNYGEKDCFYVDGGRVNFWECNEYSYNKMTDKGYAMYPTQEFAELHLKKVKFLQRCIYFKWKYDRDYVPDWKSEDFDKWYVYKEYSTKVPEYRTEVESTSDENHIYFSSEKIAEKCAEWLNYVYGETEK